MPVFKKHNSDTLLLPKHNLYLTRHLNISFYLKSVSQNAECVLIIDMWNCLIYVSFIVMHCFIITTINICHNLRIDGVKNCLIKSIRDWYDIFFQFSILSNQRSKIQRAFQSLSYLTHNIPLSSSDTTDKNIMGVSGLCIINFYLFNFEGNSVNL